jgi:hypothetical protein
VAAEAAREDAGRLDRRRLAEGRNGEQRAKRETPAPAAAAGVVLRVADDLDDGKDVLPAGRVADGEVALLDARPPGRRMGTQRIDVDGIRQEPARRAANEEPVLHRGFLTGPGYARSIRTLAGIGVVLTAIAAGCGGSSHSQSTPPPPSGTTTVAPPATTTEPLAGAETTPVSAAATAGDTALLERVALGRHEGFDRVVFQFRGDGLPGYRVEYATPPFAEDGSGNPVSVDGNAFVVVRMQPASGFDVGTGEGVIVYKGPKRLQGSAAGTSNVKELVRTGDFEAVLAWTIGLDAKVPFLVTTASSPSRLIVDFRA